MFPLRPTAGIPTQRSAALMLNAGLPFGRKTKLQQRLEVAVRNAQLRVIERSALVTHSIVGQRFHETDQVGLVLGLRLSGRISGPLLALTGKSPPRL